MKTVTKNAVQYTELQYTVEEDGFVYQGTIRSEGEKAMDEKAADAAIAAEFAQWKALMQAPAKVMTVEEKTATAARLEKDAAYAAAKAATLRAEVSKAIEVALSKETTKDGLS
jgi:hypothetical protein